MDYLTLLQILDSTIRLATPLLLACLAGLFSERAGIFDIRITAPDVETVGKLQEAISATGQFTASIQSTDKVDDRITSRIQIREAGS